LSAHNGFVISFSHFLPRIDVMPSGLHDRTLYPVLGTTRLEQQLRRLRPAVHVYGHSHLNRDVMLEDVRYINNAFGYPHEGHFTTKRLKCVHCTDKSRTRCA
jgi:hypothetical protein